jgi:hypothetical protein
VGGEWVGFDGACVRLRRATCVCVEGWRQEERGWREGGDSAGYEVTCASCPSPLSSTSTGSIPPSPSSFHTPLTSSKLGPFGQLNCLGGEKEGGGGVGGGGEM